MVGVEGRNKEGYWAFSHDPKTGKITSAVRFSYVVSTKDGEKLGTDYKVLNGKELSKV